MTKIEALKKTVYNLENNVMEYKWTDPNSCNCGILARTVCDNANEVYSLGFHDPERNWDYCTFSGYAYCMETNLPLSTIFQNLKDTGFSFEEIHCLENLSDIDILKRMGKGHDLIDHLVGSYRVNLYRGDKKYLIQYLKAWILILEEQEVKPVKEVIRYVSVPESILQENIPVLN